MSMTPLNSTISSYRLLSAAFYLESLDPSLVTAQLVTQLKDPNSEASQILDVPFKHTRNVYIFEQANDLKKAADDVLIDYNNKKNQFVPAPVDAEEVVTPQRPSASQEELMRIEMDLKTYKEQLSRHEEKHRALAHQILTTLREWLRQGRADDLKSKMAPLAVEVEALRDDFLQDKENIRQCLIDARQTLKLMPEYREPIDTTARMADLDFNEAVFDDSLSTETTSHGMLKGG